MALNGISPGLPSKWQSWRCPVGSLRLGLSRPKARVVLLAAVVSLLVWLTFRPVLTARALTTDDGRYLTNNASVKNPSLTSAWRFISEVQLPTTVPGYYQPLSMLSLMLDCAVGGNEANLLPFHRTNLLLHVAASLLVFAVVYQLFGSSVAAACATLLWGVHGTKIESVAWVSDRKTLLASVFAFSSLFFYLRSVGSHNRRTYWMSLITYLLAVLSKPTILPLPLVLVVLDWWPLRRLNKATMVEKVPFFILGAALTIVAYVSQRDSCFVKLPSEYGVSRVPLAICYSLWLYLGKVAWPVDLLPVGYPFPSPMSLANPVVAAGVILSVVLFVVAVASLTRTRAVVACLAIVFVWLLPAMQIIQFTEDTIASDKHLYAPSLGLAIALGALSQTLSRWRRWTSTRRCGSTRTATVFRGAGPSRR
jgi:hypothetical protein